MTHVESVIARIHDAVQDLANVDTSGLDEASLSNLLGAFREPMGRLAAVQTRWAGDLSSRRVVAVPPERRSGAVKDVDQEVGRKLGLAPWEARRTTEVGRLLKRYEATAAAFANGEIREEHVRHIARALKHLVGQRCLDVEVELLDLARRHHPVAFGRDVRRIMLRETPEDAITAERRQHMQRSVRATDTADGGLAFSGLLYGVQAETARVALKAFRRPDTPGEHRSPEQRTADGFEQLCAAALRANEAPAQHGSRPQVVVVVNADQLADDLGMARFISGQPISIKHLRPLLADSAFGRILTSGNSTPLEASEMSRAVPAGLWRALLVRDGGCTWEGCDAPASWCDVAHGDVPYRHEGRLSPSNAALLCRRHHRRFDAGDWQIVIHGDQVSYERSTATGFAATSAFTAMTGTSSSSRRAAVLTPSSASSRRTPDTRKPEGVDLRPEAETWDEAVVGSGSASGGEATDRSTFGKVRDIASGRDPGMMDVVDPDPEQAFRNRNDSESRQRREDGSRSPPDVPNESKNHRRAIRRTGRRTGRRTLRGIQGRRQRALGPKPRAHGANVVRRVDDEDPTKSSVEEPCVEERSVEESTEEPAEGPAEDASTHRRADQSVPEHSRRCRHDESRKKPRT